MSKQKDRANTPSAEKILSLLAELYAKQEHVKIQYIIETGETK